MKAIAILATAAFATFSASAADVVTLQIKASTVPGGKPYTGTVELSPRGKALGLSWKLSSGDAYRGIGVANPKFLAGAYGAGEVFGVSVMKIRKDGTLDSTWTTSDDAAGRLGQERLTGGKDLAGDYTAAGLMPDGKTKYTGVVSFRQKGSVYEVLWKNPDGTTSFTGVGLKGPDSMVVAWSKSGKVGAVAYILGKDGKSIDGFWIAPGLKEPGTESLTAPTENFSFTKE